MASTAITTTITLDKSAISAEIFEPPHDGKRHNQIEVVVYDWRTSQPQHILLTLAYRLNELSLLCLAVLALVKLINNNRTEQLDTLVKVYATQLEPRAVAHLRHKELLQTLVIDDKRLDHRLSLLVNRVP